MDRSIYNYEPPKAGNGGLSVTTQTGLRFGSPQIFSESRTMKPEITDHSVVLTDTVRNTSVKEWKISAENLGGEWSKTDWSITKRVLAGGRQDGVEVIDVFNGVMTFRVVPTRGFHIWSANVGETRLGWDSPVTEIVHPKYVQLSERGGLGWLNGFGEMLSRCGLESFGPPCDDSGRVYTLHGRINYIPARYVEVRLELVQRPRIVLIDLPSFVAFVSIIERKALCDHRLITTSVFGPLGEGAVEIDVNDDPTKIK
jgi:hypothetical protein